MAKNLGHLSACLQETPVRQDDFAHADSRGVVKETHDRSLFGGRFAVGLQCLFVFLFFFVGAFLAESFFDHVFGVILSNVFCLIKKHSL